MRMALTELMAAIEREPVPAVDLPAKECERDGAGTGDGDAVQTIDFHARDDRVLALDGPYRAGAPGGGDGAGEQQRRTREREPSVAGQAVYGGCHRVRVGRMHPE